MNLSPDWVPALTTAGYEAVHWSTVGDIRATDREIMTWARANGYMCLQMTWILGQSWQQLKQKLLASFK